MPMPVSEKEWQARDDARILAEAEEIKEDPLRLQPAKEAAAKMADEKKDEADALRKAARKKAAGSKGAPAGQGKRATKARGQKGSSFNVFKRI